MYFRFTKVFKTADLKKAQNKRMIIYRGEDSFLISLKADTVF